MGSNENQIKTIQENLNEEEEACSYALQLASGSAFHMVLRSAIELDLLEIIAKFGEGAHISPSKIASQLPTKNPDAPVMLDRMLRLLASYKVLTCKTCTVDDDGGRIERLYGLGPVCKFLVKNEQGVSVAPMILLNQDEVLMHSWYNLKDAVLDGGVPFEKGYGMKAFEYLGIDDRFNIVFNKAMSNHTTITMKKILETYKGFEGLNSIVDVAGGIGANVNMIVSKYPTIKGINFDLPHVIKDAPSYPGVEHVGGDMFVSVPKGDAIFMKWILHDWSDEHNLKTLKNCYKALPDNGKVIIVEFMIPEFLETTTASRIIYTADNLMLSITRGGKERTEKEYEALAKGAGFSGFRVVCCAYNSWIMEFLK